MNNTFFWVMSISIVSLQLVNHWFYGKGRLDVSYKLSILAFTAYLVLETALALNNPDQRGILLFNLTNLWGLFNSIKGYRRERQKKITGV